MKNIKVMVNVQHAGFPNNAPDEMMEVKAKATGVDGLVILEGKPYVDYGGAQRFGKDGPQIYSTKWGLPIGPSLNYRTIKETGEVVDRMGASGLDWANIPDCRLEENRTEAEKYREVLRNALYGEDQK